MMTIPLKLPPEVEAKLRESIARHDVESLRQLLALFQKGKSQKSKIKNYSLLPIPNYQLHITHYPFSN
ncbi:MAG: hypothetical protein ACREPR_20010 [Brasilonema sp.]